MCTVAEVQTTNSVYQSQHAHATGGAAQNSMSWRRDAVGLGQQPNHPFICSVRPMHPLFNVCLLTKLAVWVCTGSALQRLNHQHHRARVS